MHIHVDDPLGKLIASVHVDGKEVTAIEADDKEGYAICYVLDENGKPEVERTGFKTERIEGDVVFKYVQHYSPQKIGSIGEHEVTIVLNEQQVINLFYKVMSSYIRKKYDSEDDMRSYPEIIRDHLIGLDGPDRREWMESLLSILVISGGDSSRNGASLVVELGLRA